MHILLGNKGGESENSEKQQLSCHVSRQQRFHNRRTCNLVICGSEETESYNCTHSRNFYLLSKTLQKKAYFSFYLMSEHKRSVKTTIILDVLAGGFFLTFQNLWTRKMCLISFS